MAQAEVSTERMFDTVAFFAGQGANHNLKELPERIIAGNPEWERSYLNAIGLGVSRDAVGQSGGIFASIVQGYEVVLAQHHGMQENAEVGAAYTLRTPDLELGALGLNFGSGIGLSYALGTPSYEDGSAENPQKRYHLQLLLLFEFEWHLRQFVGFSLITRMHHRSGMYGVIAPRHVGSNFLVTGVRYQF